MRACRLQIWALLHNWEMFGGLHACIGIGIFGRMQDKPEEMCMRMWLSSCSLFISIKTKSHQICEARSFANACHQHPLFFFSLSNVITPCITCSFSSAFLRLLFAETIGYQLKGFKLVFNLLFSGPSLNRSSTSSVFLKTFMEWNKTTHIFHPFITSFSISFYHSSVTNLSSTALMR